MQVGALHCETLTHVKMRREKMSLSPTRGPRKAPVM